MQRRRWTSITFVIFNANILKAVEVDIEKTKKWNKKEIQTFAAAKKNSVTHGNELRKFIVACNSIFKRIS